MARPRLVETEEILQVARECFLEGGPSVTTAVIAARLGVSQAALFKRFQTKEALMVAALAPKPAEWLGTLETPLAPPSAQGQLEGVIAALLAFVRRNSPAMNMLRCSGMDPARFREAVGGVAPPVVALRVLAAWLTEGVRVGAIRTSDPGNLAMSLMGAVHGRVFVGQLLGPSEGLGDDDAFVRALVETIWRGVRVEGS